MSSSSSSSFASALQEGAHTLLGATTGSGVFSTYIASVGTFTRGFSIEHGAYGTWTTSAIPGSKAGFRTNAVITNRGRDFSFTCRFKISSTSGVNFFLGFADDDVGTFLTTGTAADPLNNLDGLGVSLSGGNMKIAHNDVSITESETTVFDDFIESVLFESRVYDLSIASTNSTDGNVQVSIASPAIDPAPITATSATLSSGLPDASRNLEIQVFVESTAVETKAIEVYNCSGAF